MQTWMFMLGIQMIIFVICAVWVGVWMNRDKDEYDEAFEKTISSEPTSNRYILGLTFVGGSY